MFNNMGMSKGDMAMFTSLLYLPWVIKPLWSPFVDIIKTKRWWIMVMQVLMSVAFAALAFSLPHPSPEVIAEGSVGVSLFAMTLVLFWITAFASATHDIAADGFSSAEGTEPLRRHQKHILQTFIYLRTRSACGDSRCS